MWCISHLEFQDVGQVTFKRMVFALVTLAMLAVSHAADFYLEAVNSAGQINVIYRSNASNGVAVSLHAGESIQLVFCLRQTTVIEVREVRYSNDGRKETLTVTVDNHLLGNFTSRMHTNWGHLWNVFIAAPLQPHSLTLLEGWHSLRVDVLPPSDGIELDTIHFWLDDEDLSRAVVDCKLSCVSLSSLTWPDTSQVRTPAVAEQNSYPTRCAEEDNVKVPLYLHSISEYSIIASRPQYKSFANRRKANNTNCSFLRHVLWTFSDLPKPSSASFSRSTNDVKLSNLHFVEKKNFVEIFQISFLLIGRSKGLVDAEIGSVLTLVVRPSAAQLVIKVSYLGRKQALGELPSDALEPGKTRYQGHIPDHTWKDNATSVIWIEFQSTLPVHVTDIILERRPMRGEKVTTVYQTPTLLVEAIEVDFWWRRPEQMQLQNGESGETWSMVDFFRMSLNVPWNGGFAQVFVMYQDGNVRLLPLPPLGVDWIPFGSSVLVGYSNPADLRPSAPAKLVTFYPSTLVMHVQYYDGGLATLQLSSHQTYTQLTVSEIQAGNSDPWRLPFTTLRSMYVELGNSDCDSLLVDGQKYRSIMDNWRTLQGNTFTFFRRCESSHLNLSPDITISLKDAKSLAVTSDKKSPKWNFPANQTKNSSSSSTRLL